MPKRGIVMRVFSTNAKDKSLFGKRCKTKRGRIGYVALIALVAMVFGRQSGTLLASSKPQQTEPGTVATSQKPEAADGARNGQPTSSPAEATPLSDAERIARLQRAIAENEKLFGELQAKLNDPQDEYAKADAEFGRLDRDFQDKKKELQRQQQEPGTGNAESIASEITALEPQWRLAKERFDLAIKARKSLQEQISTLEQKIRQDQDALKKLTEVKPSPPAQIQPSAPDGTGASVSPPGTPAPATAPPTTPATEVAPATPVVAPPGAALLPPTAPAPSNGAAPPTAAKPSPLSPQLVKAREEAGQKATEAAEAEQEAQSIGDRVAALLKSIELERSQLANARQRAENAQETERALEADLQRRLSEGTDEAERNELRKKIGESRERFREAREEIRVRTDRLDTLQSDLSELQSEELAAMRAAEEKRTEAEKAREKVVSLQNPFAARNVLQWTINHGPRILLILLGMVAVVWIARLLERRVTDWMAHHGKARGTTEDENRAKTLVGVFHNAIRVIVLVGGSLMVLAEIGVNILPLMGGAAVLGLAAAFGGQNLLRDYFTGFMILLENQYVVNDVVTVGNVSGLVERITLRLTVLRDLEGNVHFVPNGTIATVTNKTHGWSRALFEIGVAYKENVDQVMEVLVELGKDLRRDLEFRHMILEQPEMLGVDQFGDSVVIIKFFIKTRPLMQWNVKREMLRRIKKKFDELGIEIPFPHRTVYHRRESDTKPHEGEVFLGAPQTSESEQ